MYDIVLVTNQEELDTALGNVTQFTFIMVNSNPEQELTIKAPRNVLIKIVENSNVVLKGETSVKAYGHCKVKAFDRTEVVAYDNSIVETYDHVRVDAKEDATIFPSGHSFVQSRGNSAIYAKGWCIVRTYGKERVFASGHVTVYIHRARELHVAGVVKAHVYPINNIKIVACDKAKLHVDYRTNFTADASVTVYRYYASEKFIVQDRKPVTTVKQWLQYHNVQIKDGKFVLFMVVGEEERDGNVFRLYPSKVQAWRWADSKKAPEFQEYLVDIKDIKYDRSWCTVNRDKVVKV